MTPPVQPSQQPPSTTAKGVNSTAMLQSGRWRDLAEVIQTRGSCLSQVTSPSNGLQLLQESLPAQLVLQLGQTVDWKVRPFFTGLRLNQFTFEIPPQLTAWTEAASSSTVSANPMAFINLSTNYYSKQKITADQYFPNHFQKNTRIAMLYTPTFLVMEKFFQKTFWIKITKENCIDKRRNLESAALWMKRINLFGLMFIKKYSLIYEKFMGFRRWIFIYLCYMDCFHPLSLVPLQKNSENLKQKRKIICFISAEHYKLFNNAILAQFNSKNQHDFCKLINSPKLCLDQLIQRHLHSQIKKETAQNQLFRCAYELSSCKIWMVQQLPAIEATIRIEGDHHLQKIELNLIHEFECFFPVPFMILALQLLQTTRNKVILYARFLNSHRFHDFLQLVDLVFPLEQSIPCDNEMENTAKRPHVHLCSILLRPQQQFGSAVVERADHIGHGFL